MGVLFCLRKWGLRRTLECDFEMGRELFIKGWKKKTHLKYQHGNRYILIKYISIEMGCTPWDWHRGFVSWDNFPEGLGYKNDNIQSKMKSTNEEDCEGDSMKQLWGQNIYCGTWRTMCWEENLDQEIWIEKPSGRLGNESIWSSIKHWDSKFATH